MKFNKSTSGKTSTVNRAGGKAYTMTPETRLINLSSTCLFGEAKYYGNVEDDIKATAIEVAKTNPKFVLQLANYIRSELQLRTVSVALLATAANIPECKPYVRGYTSKIIQRADELAETLSAYIDMYGKPIPNSLKKGVRDAFAKFNSYALSKYNRDGKVKLKDVIMLTHPKVPSEIIKQILDDKLEPPKTWEVAISTGGSTKENWESILPSMNYMATMRNINNFIKVGIDTSKYLPMLSAPEKVLHSRQLPFRYYSAIKAIKETSGFDNKEISKALGQALTYSVDNLPKLEGKVVIATDLSSSMRQPISTNSTLTCSEVAALFTAMADRISPKSIVYGFDSDCYLIDNLSGNILSDTDMIVSKSDGGATNGHLVIVDIIERNIVADKILYFTDSELWNSYSSASLSDVFNLYVKTVSPNAKLYIINLCGYGTTPVSEHQHNAKTICGFSENILRFINIECTSQEAYIKANY